MKILLLGSGGREHALAWKIAQSEKCEKLYIAPGNGGTDGVGGKGENVDIKATDFDAIKKFVVEQGVDMVVVGPEDPLVKGIYDNIKSKYGIRVTPITYVEYIRSELVKNYGKLSKENLNYIIDKLKETIKL